MSDYISKEKLMSHIESQYKSFGEDYDALQILGDIEDFPTEQRPHGEWKYNQYDGNPNIGNWHCSECRHIVFGGYSQKPCYNFCPNCGADMRKEG